MSQARTAHVNKLRHRLPVGALTLMLLAGCQQAGPPPIASTALMAIETPPPDYPVELACDDVGGKVVLQLTINGEGQPTAIRTLESSRVPALDAAAHDGVRTWRFEPATRSGQPVSAQLNVPVTFNPPPVRPARCFVLDEQRRDAL